MIALPYSRLVTVATGQLPSAGQARTAGQAGQWGDLGYTAAGTPVFVFNPECWASLYLVTVEHAGERRHSWVFGSPARLTDLAARIGVPCKVTSWNDELLDEQLPPVEFVA